MLLCIKQFMFLYRMTPVAKRTLSYHKNMMYFEEHAVDIRECHWQNVIPSQGRNHLSFS